MKLLHTDKAIIVKEQAIMTQANREASHNENPQVSTIASMLRDYIRINPLVYYGSKTNGVPQKMMDEVYKTLCAMKVNE